MKNLKNPDYLGGGVYVGHDGYQLWISTSDGQITTNEIALDTSIYSALLRYVKRIEFSQEETK